MPGAPEGDQLGIFGCSFYGMKVSKAISQLMASNNRFGATRRNVCLVCCRCVLFGTTQRARSIFTFGINPYTTVLHALGILSIPPLAPDFLLAVFGVILCRSERMAATFASLIHDTT